MRVEFGRSGVPMGRTVVLSMQNLSHHIREMKATGAYTPDPLGEEQLAEILEAGRWTSSSLNTNEKRWDE